MSFGIEIYPTAAGGGSHGPTLVGSQKAIGGVLSGATKNI
jgi:hypothetical protein